MRKRIWLGRAKLESDSKKLLNIIKGVAPSKNIVIFRLGKDAWIISMDYLVQVLRAQKYTLYGESSQINLLRGYIIINKEPIPIISIHQVFETAPIRDIDIHTSILLCEIHDFKFGILCDDVLEVLPQDDNAFRSIPEHLLAKYRHLIKGAHTWRDQIALFIELKNLFKNEDILILREEGEKIKMGYESL